MFKGRFGKWVWIGIGVLIALHIYFVRELLAAEFLFAVGLAALLLFFFVVYVVDLASDRGIEWTEAQTRALAKSARRGIEQLEEISKRSSHHPRSASAR